MPEPPHGRWQAVVAVLTVAAWVSYTSWVLAAVLPTRIDNLRAWVSELGADGQPFHDVYRYGDRISGILLVATGAAVVVGLRSWHAHSRWRLLAALWAFGGVSLFVESFHALTCAPSLDTACRDMLTGGNPGPAEQVHAVTSFVGTGGLLFGLGVLWWTLRRHRGGRWYLLGVMTALAAIGELLSGLSIGPLVGLIQRIALGLMALAGIWSMVWVIRSHAGLEADGPAGEGRIGP